MILFARGTRKTTKQPGQFVNALRNDLRPTSFEDKYLCVISKVFKLKKQKFDLHMIKFQVTL